VGDMANTSLRLPGKLGFDWPKEPPANLLDPYTGSRLLPRPG
jgi:hypothetical protein